MGKKIAMGFHTCVDYELVWDTAVAEEAIRAFDIHAAELKVYHEVASERELWIGCLALLQAGIGGEMMPQDPKVCIDFSDRFRYEITLGGTATRAAIVMDKMGYGSALQTSRYNRHVERLMPKLVEVLPGVPADHNDIYPHVVLQCAGGVRVHANDIDFVTPRENRILITSDLDSLHIPVLDQAFGAMLGDCEVFLMGCFSEILDRDILVDRVEKTRRLFTHLPEDALIVLEDGCYVKKDFRYYVHEQLCPHAHILSMNEDELQEYIGRRIDILDPDAVIPALETVHKNSGIPLVLVHAATDVPLVLHGGSGIPDDQLLVAFSKGINKFNLGTDYLRRYFTALKEFTEENAKNPDPVKVINMPAYVQAKLQPYVEDRLRTLCHF